MTSLKRWTGSDWEYVVGGTSPPITLGYAQVTANQTGISTETDLTGLTVTVNVASGRRLRITGYVLWGRSVSSDGTATLRIREGGTQIHQTDESSYGFDSATLHVAAIVTPSPGSHTYKLTLQRPTGTGTLSLLAAPTYPSYILVEDITGGSDTAVGVPACRVRRTSALSVPNNTVVFVPFDAERYDTDNMHSTSVNTGRITINTPGVYDIGAYVNFDSESEYNRNLVVLRLNGATDIAAQETQGSDINSDNNQTVTTHWQCNAGDYVEVFVIQTNPWPNTRNLNVAEFWATRIGSGPSGGSGTAVLTPDNTPASPNAADYEFDGSGSTLPSGWAWVNQGSSTYVEGSGAGKLLSPAAAPWSLSLIKRAVPGGNWTATAKITGWTEGSSANTSGLGMWLRESSTGRLISLHWDQGQAAEGAAINNWTSPTAFSALVANGKTGIMPGRWPVYYRIRKNSSTSYDFHVSPDGVSWYPVLTAHNPTAWMTPDEIGFGPIQSTASGTKGGEAACWFMRFV